jgi:hypothetical protein
MSAIKLSTPSSGSISLSPADTASNLTITVPASTTTMVGTDTTQTLTNKTLTTPNINSAQVATVSGTAPLYMCRAWVNFNGIGTVSIRASGNVSSITDGGTGIYTVNLTTAMPDVNYSAAFSVGDSGASNQCFMSRNASTTSSITIRCFNASSVLTDFDPVYVAIFR